MVTFSFDDVPMSALEQGAVLLDQAKVLGTFYLASALIGRRTDLWTVIDRDGVRELHRRGHEIALHGHVHLPVGSHRDARTFAADIALNHATIREIDSAIPIENFAYPYGHLSIARKMQLAHLVRSSRSIEIGVNSGIIDTQLIKIVPLVDPVLSLAELNDWLDRTVAVNGWLVFMIHDVSETPSPFGVTPRLLSHAIEGAMRRGIANLSMRAALDAAKVRVAMNFDR